MPLSSRSPVVLAGDVGGTKTLLALVTPTGEVLTERRFVSRDFSGLTPIIQEFLRELGSEYAIPTVGAFGIAGPVDGDVCVTTNLPWRLDARDIARDLGLVAVRLLNDFAATAHGVHELSSGSLATIQDGKEDPSSLSAVIGAGTGLGVALMIPSAAGERMRVRAMATEGGHGDFAPQTDVQIDLLRFLRARFGHVSTERVVSGMGLAGIYEFFSTIRGVETSPSVASEIDAGDAGAVIGAHAALGDDAACVATIALFLECYGAEVGNLALRALPRAGLFITGGIAPRLVDRMREGPFLQALRDKGRMRAVVETIPVHVVLEPRVALLGAAAIARSLA